MTILTLDRRLEVGDEFDSLGSEDASSFIRPSTVVESQGVRALVDGLEEYLLGNSRFPYEIQYSAEDLTQFSSGLREAYLRDFYVSKYLEQAVNLCKDDKITLLLNNGDSTIHSIGENLENKSLTVYGNANKLGNHMKSGTIHLIGNVNEKNYLHGTVGCYMSGGTITIDGNVLFSQIGDRMNGGQIFINGGVGNIYANGGARSKENGRIYLNGKLSRINGRKARFFDRWVDRLWRKR